MASSEVCPTLMSLNASLPCRPERVVLKLAVVVMVTDSNYDQSPGWTTTHQSEGKGGEGFSNLLHH